MASKLSSNTTTLLILHAPQQWLMNTFSRCRSRGSTAPPPPPPPSTGHPETTTLLRPTPLRRTKSLAFQQYQDAFAKAAAAHPEPPQFPMDEEDTDGPTWIY